MKPANEKLHGVFNQCSCCCNTYTKFTIYYQTFAAGQQKAIRPTIPFRNFCLANDSSREERL